MARKVVIVLVAGLVTLAATACNTVKGAGEDLQSASDEVNEEI